MIFQPIYLMLKPVPTCALAMEQLSRLLGIDSSYARDRYHVTLLPLGDARLIPDAKLAQLVLALQSLQAEPFDTVHRNVLTGGSNRELRAFQRALVRLLIAAGMPKTDYAFKPHGSLAYGPAPERRIKVDPISWRADELLLIKSIHGAGRHEPLARFPLTPAQGSFDF